MRIRYGSSDVCSSDLVTAYIDGVHGDTNATFLAGDVSEEHRLLVERTHEATMRAIKAVKTGRALLTVGRVIEGYATRFGYHVVSVFTGQSEERRLGQECVGWCISRWSLIN